MIKLFLLTKACFLHRMINMKTKLKRLHAKLLGFMPRALPAGMTEFDNMVERLMSVYTLPTSDVNSIKNVLSATITTFGPTVYSKPDYFFVKLIRAAAAKQVAGEVFFTLQMAKRKAYEDAQKIAASTKSADIIAINSPTLQASPNKEPA